MASLSHCYRCGGTPRFPPLTEIIEVAGTRHYEKKILVRARCCGLATMIPLPGRLLREAMRWCAGADLISKSEAVLLFQRWCAGAEVKP